MTSKVNNILKTAMKISQDHNIFGIQLHEKTDRHGQSKETSGLDISF
jgi:hypothetical protein